MTFEDRKYLITGIRDRAGNEFIFECSERMAASDLVAKFNTLHLFFFKILIASLKKGEQIKIKFFFRHIFEVFLIHSIGSSYFFKIL